MCTWASPKYFMALVYLITFTQKECNYPVWQVKIPYMECLRLERVEVTIYRPPFSILPRNKTTLSKIIWQDGLGPQCAEKTLAPSWTATKWTNMNRMGTSVRMFMLWYPLRDQPCADTRTAIPRDWSVHKPAVSLTNEKWKFVAGTLRKLQSLLGPRLGNKPFKYAMWLGDQTKNMKDNESKPKTWFWYNQGEANHRQYWQCYTLLIIEKSVHSTDCESMCRLGIHLMLVGA